MMARRTTEVRSSDASRSVTVLHEPESQLWSARVGAESVGTLTYQLAGDRYVLISTHVSDAQRHRGVATRLVITALDDIQREGKRVTVICPFVGDVIARNPDYFDLVDPVHPGPGISGTQAGASSPHSHQPASTAPSTPATPEDEDNMEQIDRIMVLGTVAYRGPLTATGIERELRDGASDTSAAKSRRSIDRQVRLLAEAGHIRRQDSSATGETEYHCTENGRSELRRLLLRLLHTESPRPFDLEPLLHFVTSVSLAELADGLRRRILRIDEVLAHESSVIAHSPVDGPDHRSQIARLSWHRFTADRRWSLEFIGQLYGAEPAIVE